MKADWEDYVIIISAFVGDDAILWRVRNGVEP